VSSSAVGSTARGRSQSVLSRASVDNESVTGKRVKPEPSTPADQGDISTTIESTPIGTQLGKRRRANTLQAAVQGPNKRKRSTRELSEASEVIEPAAAAEIDVSIFTRPQQIPIARNFNRTSQAVMQEIQAHKYASLFNAPVREKDAEGYYDMIRRPQDLKSIKNAINAGSRAVNTATSDMTPGGNSPASGPTTGGTVVLPLSADIMPPKGIVNSGQLEKEVMRMFANAVLFNPGEDDPVVKDTREMFVAAEAQVSNWKSAERKPDTGAGSSARRADEEDDTVVGDDTGGLSTGKRRKLA